jgi:hypothetical protein
VLTHHHHHHHPPPPTTTNNHHQQPPPTTTNHHPHYHNCNCHPGAHTDLMESFFLSETVKYLYLTFSDAAPHLIDYYILSTEGHLLPVVKPEDAGG